MALSNLYWGSTISQSGGSYLYSKAIINVKEGYQIGSSTHTVEIGDFEVNVFENSGVNDQKIRINAVSPVNRLSNTTVLFNKSYKNTTSFLDDFVSEDFYLSNWNPENNEWVLGTDILTLTNPTVASVNFCTSLSNIKNVRMIAKLRSTGFVSNGARPGIIIRGSGDSNTNYSGYVFQWALGSFQLYRVVNGSITTLGTTAVALSDSTYYWFMIVAYNSKLLCYYSSDGKIFTQVFNVNDDVIESGNIGIRHKGSGSFSTDFDFVEVQEVNNEYTNEDIIKQTLALGGIFETEVTTDLNDLAGFVANTGSSWVAGSTNEVTLYPTTGTSWHTYVGNTSTFSEFVMECEVYGNSGNYAGLVVGSSNNRFYGNYYKFGGNSGINNAIFWNGTGLTFNGRGDYVNLQANRWYRAKMVRSNFDIRWYINNVLTNSISGASFLLSDPRFNFNVGFFGYQTGTTTIKFRNIRISKLDQLAEDLEIEPNQNLSSVYNRYMPEGYVSIWNNKVKIFSLGSSRGSYTLGLSSYIISASEVTDNNAFTHIVTVNGFDNSTQESGDKSRFLNQVDSLRTEVINDQRIQSTGDAKSVANAVLINNEISFNEVEVDLHPLVHFEQYDSINFVHQGMGISRNTIIKNNLKTFELGSGNFRQTLTLG